MAEDTKQYVPNEEQAFAINYAKALYEAALEAKRPVMEAVARYERLWRGDHWIGKGPSYRSRPVSNFIFSLVETAIAWLTELRHKIIVDPMGPEDEPIAKDLEKIISDYLWHECQVPRRLKRMYRSALIRGRGFLKVSWDAMKLTAAGNLGEVAVDYVPWHEIYLDPAAHDIEEARFICHVRDVPLSELARRFPEHAPYMKPAPGADESPSFVAVSDPTKPVFMDDMPHPYTQGQVQVIEVWLREDSKELQAEFAARKDKPAARWADRLYKRGRLIIVAGDVLLYDGPPPYIVRREGDVFPFVSMSAYEDDNNVWDLSEVSQIESPQRVINMLEARMVDWARQVANTPWIKDANSGVKAEDLTNEEGLVITKNPGTEVRRDPPPPFPAFIFQLYLQMMRNMEIITGMHDVTQGRRPTGITAAAAIAQLREAAQARIRDKARHAEQAVERLAQLMLNRVLQFYGPERMVRVLGEGGRAEWRSVSPLQIQIGVDLRLIPGTSLEMNEALRMQMAREFFQVGIIDRQAALEASNWPDKEAVLARMRAAEEQQMLMAALTGGRNGRSPQMPPLGGPQAPQLPVPGQGPGTPLPLSSPPAPGPVGGFAG